MELSFAVNWCRQSAVAAIVLCLNLPIVHAQEVSPTNTVARATVSLTLDAIVTKALKKNPELKFYEAEIAAANVGRKTAWLLCNPQLSGDVSHNAQKFAGLSAEGVAWSVFVVQPFKWPGRIGFCKAIANHDIGLAQPGCE